MAISIPTRFRITITIQSVSDEGVTTPQQQPFQCNTERQPSGPGLAAEMKERHLQALDDVNSTSHTSPGCRSSFPKKDRSRHCIPPSQYSPNSTVQIQLNSKSSSCSSQFSPGYNTDQIRTNLPRLTSVTLLLHSCLAIICSNPPPSPMSHPRHDITDHTTT